MKNTVKYWNISQHHSFWRGYNGTMFNMNSTFRSSNGNLTWVAEESYEKRIELDGGIVEINDPYAQFSFSKNFVIPTDSDSLSSGSYLQNWWYRLQIDNREDSSHTILGDLNFSASGDDIIWVGERQYATWNKTSAKWTFPSEYMIRENEGFGVGFDTNYTTTKTLNVDVNRWIEPPEFSTDGYQLANFSVTFKDKNFQWVWARIEAFDYYPGYGIDASIVPGTFSTNAPGNFQEDENVVHFDIDKELLQTGFTYNFSVIIRVNLTGERQPPIHFKPEFAIGEGFYHDQDYGNGYNIEVPPSMLPEHINQISASTNVSNTWLINRFDHVIALLRDDMSPPVITDFKVSPNTSVGKNNPAVGSAQVFDENLKEVTGAVVDSNNLVSTNRTILRLFMNQSGLNGYYVSPPWHGNFWNITNGSQDEIITAISHDSRKDYIFVAGKFRKNHSTSEVGAALWFNSTTYLLSNITMMDASATQLNIENGASTFSALTSKFMEDNGPPIEIEGTFFTLYDLGNSSNPKIESSEVRSGIYSAFVHAVDLMGNENGMMLEVSVDNTPPMVRVIEPLNNTSIRYLDNIVKGEVKDVDLTSAKLFVMNGTGFTVSQYDLNISNNNFSQRVEFAPYQNNTLKLIAEDKAGNTNATFIKVFVNNNSNQTTLNVNISIPVLIDARNETDTEIEFISNINQSNVTFTITSITNQTKINDLNSSAFASSSQMAVGKIVEINLTGLNATNESEVQSVLIKMYYTIADLDLNSDGIIGAGDLDENNMFIYWLNTTDGNWTKLITNNPTWVIDSGRVKISVSAPGNAWVKVSHLSTFGLAAGLVPQPTGGGPIYHPSSGGGGGGGGGGTSGENYTNIVMKENYDEAIYKDKVTSYKFKNSSNPVTFVNITGNVSAGLINTAVEVLKGTSTLVKESAPGTVYKNVNIWVGTSGFATSKNIKEAIVVFRVENSWFDSNAIARSDIKLVRWDGAKWITLETSEKMRDGTYTYFEGKTVSFSPFAITGIRAAPSAATPTATQPVPTGTPVTTAAQGEAPTTNLALIMGVIILIAIGVGFYLWRKK